MDGFDLSMRDGGDRRFFLWREGREEKRRGGVWKGNEGAGSWLGYSTQLFWGFK